jgi:Zn/Cd-binding protein ZinT
MMQHMTVNTSGLAVNTTDAMMYEANVMVSESMLFAANDQETIENFIKKDMAQHIAEIMIQNKLILFTKIGHSDMGHHKYIGRMVAIDAIKLEYYRKMAR